MNKFDRNDVDQFSRGGINFTYQLIRPLSAPLALKVRNIAGGQPSIKGDSPTADYFLITLDSFEVRAVVESLAKLGTLDSLDPGKAVMAQALIEDWLQLARKMINDLPEDQRPF